MITLRINNLIEFDRITIPVKAITLMASMEQNGKLTKKQQKPLKSRTDSVSFPLLEEKP